MSEVWDGSNEVYENGIDEGSGNTYIRVNGSNIMIEPGVSFAQVVKDTAKNAGLGKFRVFLNNTEISPSDAPSLVQEGSAIELRPYDVAGY